MGDAVRYPDALVTCAPQDGRALTVSGVVAVFEIVSPGTGRVDRIMKVREYGRVPSIRCYVMLESTAAGLLLLSREEGGAAWTALTLTDEDMLALPALGIEILVAELYEGVAFSAPDAEWAAIAVERKLRRLGHGCCGTSPTTSVRRATTWLHAGGGTNAPTSSRRRGRPVPARMARTSASAGGCHVWDGARLRRIGSAWLRGRPSSLRSVLFGTCPQAASPAHGR
jgi:hypothetical protein